MTLNATIFVQMIHLLIAYYVMYHVFIKYALQLLMQQRNQEHALAQSAAFLKNKEIDAQQELRRTQLHLQKRLFETIPQEVPLKKSTSVDGNIGQTPPSEDVIKKVARELSVTLEKDVLS